MPASHSRRRYLSMLGACGLVGVAGCTAIERGRRVLADPGDERWTFTTGTDEELTLGTTTDTVYTGSSGGTLYAVDATSGEQQWTVDVDGSILTPPVIADGTIYVGTDSATLYAIEAETATQSWTVDTEEPMTAPPLVTDNTIYIGTDQLYQVDPDRGDRTVFVESDAPIQTTPKLVGERLYLGDTSGRLSAIDTVTGDLLWNRSVREDALVSPLYHEGLVYTGSIGVPLTIVDAQDGDLVAESDVLGGETVILMDGYVYLQTPDGVVTRLDRGGDREWSVQLPATATSPLAGFITYGTVCIGTADEQIRVFNTNDGSDRWTFNTNGVVRTCPALAGGTVCVGTDTGHLHGLTEKVE